MDAIYRKVYPRLYGDEKFQRLSPPQPCGRYLWIYLLSGPYTTSIPGLSVVGEAALAESLEWPLEGFREAFGEVFREGLIEVDWNKRILWLPNAIRYNPPQSPNVVKSWRHQWEFVPECAMKTLIFKQLKGFMEGLGEGFANAFRQAFPKDYGESGAGAEAGAEAGEGIPPTPQRGDGRSIHSKLEAQATSMKLPDHYRDARDLVLAYREQVTDTHGYSGKPEARALLEKGTATKADLLKAITHFGRWHDREGTERKMRLSFSKWLLGQEWSEYLAGVPHPVRGAGGANADGLTSEERSRRAAENAVVQMQKQSEFLRRGM